MEFWNEILITLGRNRWRSFMTMFGVFWGIWMLIVLTGIGKGLGNGIMPGINQMPSNVAFFFPETTTIPYRGMQEGRRWKLDMDDIEAVKSKLAGRVESVGGMVFSAGATFSRSERHGDFEIRGVMPEYKNTQPMRMVFGRFLNGVDITERRKVCVIGEDIYSTLFPEGGDPTGQSIQVGSLYYMVVGVVRQPSERMSIGGRISSTALIPMTTVQQNYNRGRDVDFFIVQFADGYLAADYQDEVAQMLRQRHLVSPDDKGAMHVFNMQQMLLTVKGIFMGINVLLWIVGMGMLFAGLIGISNIVLVTVKERTQEIGVRRAIGAKPRLILMQIMSESLLLTASAGIVGLVLGVWTVALLARFFTGEVTDKTMPMLDPSVSFGFTVSALVIIIIGGLLAGLMPALRAMNIKPIDALRDE